MKYSKLIALFIVLLTLFQDSFGQNFSEEKQFKINELTLIINSQESHDTSLARAYIDLGELLVLSNIDTLISLSLKSKKVAERTLRTNPKLQVKQSLLASLADAHANIGYAYLNKGNIPKALNNYHIALKVLEKIDNKSILGSVLNNIGIIYKIQGDIPKTIEYWDKALKVREEANDTRGIANSLYNLGGMYLIQKNPKKALEYFKKALIIQTEIGDREGIAYSLNSMGILHKNNGQNAEAIEYFNKSLKVREEIGDKGGVASSLNNIAYILLSNGKINEAFNYAQRGFTIAKEVGYPASIKSSAKLLSKIYVKKNNGLKALEMYKLFITMRDSLNNETTQKAAAKQQAQYEYEKQKAIDDAEHESLIAIKQEEKEKQQILTYGSLIGLALVIIFLVFVFNRLRVTRKQKAIIENQKEEVESAHSQLEEKNQEILDSINYAKRIQKAILPPDKVVKELLKESFILYKPKDIVAGDFYWMEQIEDMILFAAADCTGHGVPGAM
ncbi:MAG: tetratricopeptide repeat protein [Flavobacteriales bacterium]|nr:tetratricopeptide repeat protein [Flavobacteriales bacterium]